MPAKYRFQQLSWHQTAQKLDQKARKPNDTEKLYVDKLKAILLVWIYT